MKSSSDFLILKFPPLLTLKRVSEEEEIFEEAFEEIEEIEEVFEEMSEETMNTCKTCKHADYADEYIDDDFAYYECLVNPPLINAEMYKQHMSTTFDTVQSSVFARIPVIVEEHHRCGKWEMK